MRHLTTAVAIVLCLGAAAPARSQSEAGCPDGSRGPAGCAGTALTLPDVLASADRAFPLLEAARQDEAAAEGEALAARGAFDLRLQASGELLRGDVYGNDRAAVTAHQPLTFGGASVFGGYRIGRGTFAPYDGKAQTLADGEWKAGVSLPLLRNRAIDSRRAALDRTSLGIDLAGQRVQTARLRVLGDAAVRYWDWVAAGRQLAVATSLLALAEARDRDLGDAIALGAVAAVERLDNQRAILQRRSAVVAARRALERQAIALSLYLRAPDGSPLPPSPGQLPDPPAPAAPPADAAVADDVARAVETRPDVRALLLSRQQQVLAWELARNELLPTLDVFADVSRDHGRGSRTLRGTEADAGASLLLPVQRRQGRGQTRAALAGLARIDADLRLARDRVRAEVQDAVSAWRAAADAVDLIREELGVARALEQAERDRFALGDSTQFLVNLRELATAEAALREIAAVAEGLKARVAYEAAVGRLAPAITRP